MLPPRGLVAAAQVRALPLSPLLGRLADLLQLDCDRSPLRDTEVPLRQRADEHVLQLVRRPDHPDRHHRQAKLSGDAEPVAPVQHHTSGGHLERAEQTAALHLGQEMAVLGACHRWHQLGLRMLPQARHRALADSLGRVGLSGC